MALTTAQIQNAYVAFFNRPADVAGLTYWSSYAGSTADLLNTFAQSTEYKNLYSGLNNTQIVNAVYSNLFGHTPDVAGLTYWVTQLDQGKLAIGNIADAINKGAQGTDATIIANKTTAATEFTKALDTTAEIVAYAGISSTGLDAVKTWLNAVTADSATLTNATSTTTLTSITNTVLNNVGGTNYTLTTGVDNLTGTGGNDIFTADNTGTNPQITAADQINGGAGTDTLKVYAKTGTAVTLGTLTSIETLFVNGNNQDLDVSGVTGLTSLQADAITGGANYTVAGQTVTLSNQTATAYTTNIKSSTDTSEALVLNTFGKSGVSQIIDLQGAKVTSASINATGGNSVVTLNNTGAALASLTVTGDKNLTLAESLATLKTINASAATGAVSVDASGATVDAAFAFTGGSGNDTLTLKAGALALISAGTQLNGGAGTDTLALSETSALTAAQVAKVNAATGFEVLGFAASGSGVDISTLSSINQFKVASGNLTETFSNATSSSKFTIDNTAANTGTITIGNKVGETSTTVAIDNQAGTTKALAKLVLTGATNVALSSSGNTAAVNSITEVVNTDNSVITLTGSTDLTLSLKKAASGTVVVGSKVDGSAFTGTLNLTGNTTAFAASSPSIGDVLIGGSGSDTLKAAINGGTLTGNGGSDTFDVSVALGGTTANFNTTTITDFTKGDKIKFVNTGTSTFTSTKVDLSGAATVGAALDLLAAGNGGTNGIVKWGNFGGNTYVVSDNTAGATFAATDIMVKLTGTLDLSTSSYTTDTLTFA